MLRREKFGFAICNTSLGDRLGRLALCQVSLSEDGKPPEWIMLVPKGEKLEGFDGRKFSNAKPQDVVDLFVKNGLELPVDWAHSTQIKAEKGERAPAAGWIDKLEVRNGEIWGHVKWNVKGAEDLEAKAFKYVSPAFYLEKATNVVMELISAGLTNTPNLDMPALANDQRNTSEQSRTEDLMDRKLLIAKLGLAETATDEEIFAALDAMKADPAKIEELEKGLAAANAKVKSTEIELNNARSATPALNEYVPRADYDKVVSEHNADKAKRAEEDKAAHEVAVNSAIESALKAGKITPATKDFYVATCATKEGLAEFSKFTEAAPKIVDPTDLDNTPPPAKGANKLTAEELVVCERLGQTEEQFLAAKSAD